MRISDWSSDVCSSDLGAVRLGDLGDHADGVGEVLLGRQQRAHGAPRQLAVADLAAARCQAEAALTHRVGREIVVQHEVLAVAAFRSEARRVGKEGVGTGRSRRSQYHYKKKLTL